MNDAGRQHGQRPQAAVGVDEAAADQPRRVGDPIGLGVEAAGRDAQERVVPGRAHVDRLGPAVGQDGGCGNRIERKPEAAREVVAAAPGQHADHRACLPDGVGHSRDQTVASEGDRHLAGGNGALGQRAGVLKVERQLHMVLEPVAPERGAHGRQRARSAPAARGRVHDQTEHQSESTSVARSCPIATGAGSVAASA